MPALPAWDATNGDTARAALDAAWDAARANTDHALKKVTAAQGLTWWAPWRDLTRTTNRPHSPTYAVLIPKPRPLHPAATPIPVDHRRPA